MGKHGKMQYSGVVDWAPWHWPPLPGAPATGEGPKAGSAWQAPPWKQNSHRQRPARRTPGWRPWTACSCGHWAYDDRKLKYCGGCGRQFGPDDDRQQPGEAGSAEVKLEIPTEKQQDWCKLLELAKQSIGEPAAAAIAAIIEPKTPQKPKAPTGPQAGKIFTAARVAKEKAEANKQRAEKETAKLEEALAASRRVLAEATKRAEEAAAALQEAVTELGKHYGSLPAADDEEEDDEMQGGPDSEFEAIRKRMAKAKAELAKDRAALAELARKKAEQAEEDEEAKRKRAEAEADLVKEGEAAAKKAKAAAEEAAAEGRTLH